jgi:hypothetical protein
MAQLAFRTMCPDALLSAPAAINDKNELCKSRFHLLTCSSDIDKICYRCTHAKRAIHELAVVRVETEL